MNLHEMIPPPDNEVWLSKYGFVAMNVNTLKKIVKSMNDDDLRSELKQLLLKANDYITCTINRNNFL